MPEDKPAGGKKVLGLPRGAVIAGAVALAGGVLYFWFTRKKTAGTSADTTTPPDTVDQAGEFSTLQTEIQGLEAQLADLQSSPAPGGPGGGGVTRYGAPTGLRVTHKTKDSVSLAWNEVTSPSKPPGYIVLIRHQGQDVARQTSTATQVTVGGLKGGTAYEARVRASGSSDSSPAASLTFTTSRAGRTTPQPHPNIPAPLPK